MLIGVIAGQIESPLSRRAGWLITAGTLVFSGSLYLLVLTGQRWMGAVTPLGGIGLLSGWLSLALGTRTKPV